MKRTLITTMALVMLLSLGASAQIPKTLNYQGVLTDGSGVAVSDGSYNLTFAIYDVLSGGSALWTDGQSVTVNKGIFSAVLGLGTPLNLDFGDTYYLGISVEANPELTPRILLTASAYALNSRGVTGDSNMFPPDGRVGIGMMAPAYKLHVRSDDPVIQRVDGNNSTWAGFYVNALQATATPMIGYLRSSVLMAYTYLDYNDNWACRIDGNTALTATSDGALGVGTSSPLEKLDVTGAIRIGTTANTNAGTIRWTGSDFEGYDGASWKTLTATGEDALPPGTAGQTLRHNGSSWAAVSSLYNDGSNIGIGTISPEFELHLYDAATTRLKIESVDATGNVSIEMKTGSDAFDSFRLFKYGQTAGGTVDGIPFAGLSRLLAGSQAGGMLFQVSTANPLYFVTQDQERMRISGSGNVGIGTTAPQSKLHISGGQWDLDATEGDFKIGDATYRLKIGVATDGLGAGTAGIRAQGGLEKLVLGGGSSEVLFVEPSGTVSIGSPTINGDLDLYGTAGSTPMLKVGSDAYGGNIWLYDEAGNITSYISADPDGEGGNMGIYRAIGSNGIFLTGNFGGTNESYLGIYGSSLSATFDMRQTGNSTVLLPTDAIGSSEILEEAGCASYVEGLSSIALTSLPTVIASRSITAPAVGYVLAIATCQGQTYHNNGAASSAHFGVSSSASAFPEAQDVLYYVHSEMPTGWFDRVVTVHGLFPVTSGTSTFYFLGEELNNNFTAFDRSLTLLFIPSAYGVISDPGALATGSTDERSNVQSKRITAGDIAAEQAECERLNKERIQRELDEMRARIDALERELESEIR